MSALPQPDPAISVYHAVESQWQSISAHALRNEPVDVAVEQLRQFIDRAEANYNQGHFNREMDWFADIAAAKALHANKVNWFKHNSTLLQRQHDFWVARVKSIEAFYTQQLQDGLKYLLALHGASAIACLNAIASDRAPWARPALLWGLFGGAVGILLLVVGLVAMLHILARQAALFEGRLSVNRGWKTYRALSRWLELPALRRLWLLVNASIYGSMLWFVVYALICFVLLASGK